MRDERQRKRAFVPRYPKPWYEREWEFGRWASWVDFGPHPNGCWLWTGNPGRKRGAFQLRGKVMDAHRAGYIITYGEQPEGLHIHHECGVKRCVNPFRLSAVTPQEHAAEHPSFARFITGEPGTHCYRGHEYTPENTKHNPNGSRSCRACNLLWRRGRGQLPPGNAARGTCKSGKHPWVPENIMYRSSGRTECKVCHRERERARLARLRQ